MSAPKTLFDKVWEQHVVHREGEPRHGDGDHLARLERSAAQYFMEVPFPREEMRLGVHGVISSNGLGACYIRPIVLRGYGVMGLHPLEAPVDVSIAAWVWGAYLGEDGLRNGIEPRDVVDAALFVVGMGFVVGHLVHVLAYNPHLMDEDPWILLKVSFSYKITV